MAFYEQNAVEQRSAFGAEFTAKCPTCGCPLNVDEKEDFIVCPQCENKYKSIELSRASIAVTSNPASNNISIASLAMSIDTPESGLVYLENFFENYDWDSYKQVTTIGIEEIDLMVEKNKIKNGANSSAWILDFQSKSIPLAKKFEGLNDLEEKMASVYDSVDNTNALEFYDTYTLIIRSLLDNKDAILKQLSMDIEYASKFGADTATCNEMLIKLNELKGKCEKLALPEKLDDVQSIITAKEKINNEIAKKLAVKGINASATYFEALNIFQSPARDKSHSLQLFESIKGFSDSADYVSRLNKFFNYDYDLFSFVGKHYVFRKDEIAIFNVDEKQKKKSEPEDYEEEDLETASFSLYEVIDGVPAEKPLFSGLTKLLTCYSNKLFYIYKNKEIRCYDVITYEETTIDEGKNGIYNTINGVDNFFFANDGKAFFMRKIIPLKLSTGCFSKVKEFFLKLFRKQKPDLHRNNYSILYVDMTNATAKTLVDEMVDITDYYGDNLFYFVADNDPESEAMHFMDCNVLTGAKKELLDDKCDVHNVINGKVVYSVWTPNDLNKDLYVYDLATSKNTLIEKNIFYFYKIIKDRIYYTVGNKDFCPLFSNNTEGNDRIEIMQNVAEIVTVRGGWMYIVKGYGKNKILLKMSTDGKQKILICNQFKEVVEFTDSYIYYLDNDSTLHVVRNDGLDDRKIAEYMKRENIIVSYDSIFYLRKEDITPEKYAYSLYKMDLSGHNSRKLIFNVDSFKNYDKDSLYLMREENVRFEITTPTTLKDNITDYQNYDVTRYFKFNKKDEKIELVLSLGLPQTDTYEFKSGCLRKKVEAKSTFREVPNKSLFKHNNVADAGSTYQSQMDKVIAAREAEKAEKAEKKLQKQMKKKK